MYDLLAVDHTMFTSIIDMSKGGMPKTWSFGLVAAHSFRATWLGEPICLNEMPLKAFDKMVTEKIADGTGKNAVVWDIVTPATMSAERVTEINKVAREMEAGA